MKGTRLSTVRRRDALEETMMRTLMPRASEADPKRQDRYQASTKKTARTLTYRIEVPR